MKIVALSDFHGDLISVPACDVVCIAGDIVPLKMQRSIPQSAKWLREIFVPWCESLDCKHVILVAGNHDFYFDTSFWTDKMDPAVVRPNEIFANNDKITYLQDNGCEIDGIKFYGTPWITGLPNWAFYTPDDTNYMKHIPDCDVLITHAPPYGDVGTVLQQCWNYGRNFGSKALRDRLIDGRIRVCVSGHIHSGLHAEEMIGDAKCYNVSVKDESYFIAFRPLEFIVNHIE